MLSEFSCSGFHSFEKQEKSLVSGGGSEGRDEEECVFPSWEGDSSWGCCGQSVRGPVSLVLCLMACSTGISGPLSDGISPQGCSGSHISNRAVLFWSEVKVYEEDYT